MRLKRPKVEVAKFADNNKACSGVAIAVRAAVGCVAVVGGVFFFFSPVVGRLKFLLFLDLCALVCVYLKER